MFVIQLLLAWGMLYLALRFIFDTGKPDRGASSGETEQNGHSRDRSGYLRDVPDALRPDIDVEDLDPTDFM